MSERELCEGFKKREKGALVHINDLYIDPLYRCGKKLCSHNKLINNTIQDLVFRHNPHTHQAWQHKPNLFLPDKSLSAAI